MVWRIFPYNSKYSHTVGHKLIIIWQSEGRTLKFNLKALNKRAEM